VLTKNEWGDQIQEVEIGWACGVRETDKCMYGYDGESAKDGLFVDKDVCGMIILEWIVRD
jgi:hypothetical protein